MDFTKVNPILGYEMYSKSDKAAINRRTAYGTEIPVRSGQVVRGLSDRSDLYSNR